MINITQRFSLIGLFVVTLFSAFSLLVGLITLTLLFWPVLAASFSNREPYRPQLPLAENRAADTSFDASAERSSAKRHFPSLNRPEQVQAGNWIRIPSIDVTVPLVMSPTMNNQDVLATLDDGAALYPNGVRPGSLGTTFISAHSTGEPWKGRFRFAFLRINELAPGNLIHVDWEGTRYTYRITERDIVRPDPDFRVVSDRPVPVLALMACWPLWSTDERMLVHAELTNITQLTSIPS